MVAVGCLAEDLVEQVRRAVDDQMLVGEARGGINAAEDFQHFQAIERAVGLVDGAKDFSPRIRGPLCSLRRRSTLSQRHPRKLAGHALTSSAGCFRLRQVEIASRLFGEGDAKGLSFFVGVMGGLARERLRVVEGIV